MKWSPKASIIGILTLIAAGIQAIAELIKASKAK